MKLWDVTVESGTSTKILDIVELGDKARKDSIVSDLPNADASEVGETG